MLRFITALSFLIGIACAGLLFPHMQNNGDTEFPGNNIYDDHSVEIQTRGTYRVFDTPFQSVWVGTNGFVTFGDGYAAYVPQAAAFWSTSKMVAPYWSDIDLRAQVHTSHIWYREERSQTLLSRADNIISSNFGNCASGFQSTHLFIVTWQRLASWCELWEAPQYRRDTEVPVNKTVLEIAPKSHTPFKQNSFQLVLATDGCRTFAFNHIHTIEWQFCWAQNQMVFNKGNGNGIGYWKHPNPSPANLVLQSNAGEPGRWVYKIDGAQIQDKTCATITTS